MNFLSNLVKIFPSLKTRPLYLTGESYAGTYIVSTEHMLKGILVQAVLQPYITKAYFGMKNPPVNLAKIAIGDGSLNTVTELEQLPTVRFNDGAQSRPPLTLIARSSPSSRRTLSSSGTILKFTNTSRNSRNIPSTLIMHFAYRAPRSHLCGYDLNLSYPGNGSLPTLNPPMPSYDEATALSRRLKQSLVKQALAADAKQARDDLARRNLEVDAMRLAKREQWKRDLSGRANGTLDPQYQCDLIDELVEYALNFSLPWSAYSD